MKNILILKNVFILTLFFLFMLTFRVYGLAITYATLTISGDDEFYAYINGNLVFETESISGNNWSNIYNINIKNFLPQCGDYVLAINYYDTAANVMSVTYKLTVTMDNGQTLTIYSDGNEKQIANGNYHSGTQTYPSGWNTLGFNDSSWTGPLYVCDSDRQTYNSIADPYFASGWVPFLSLYPNRNTEYGASALLREYFSIPCPPVTITKTINKTTFYLNETITYCFDYHNDDFASVTFNLWDTIPAVTDYIGCNGGCGVQTYGSNVVVSWTINVAANASGSVCFWVRAARYPFLFFYPDIYLCRRDFFIDLLKDMY
ncbi:MAG: hypothetical protein N3E50_00980 [Candidatus Goldbacteria bacterium]|nr:hypothetical protein [Candidatus Goldiibacteriota bacterium]